VLQINLNRELKVWSIYFITIIVAVYTHELGHCIPAWMNGFKAIPTPAKEYIMDDIPENLQQYVSLGGIIGTVLFSLLIMVLYLVRTFSYSSTLLAGSIAVPGIYTMRFFLAGRGHDATEFQEAQTALGLSYNGHSLDWLFLILFVFGIVIWIIKSNPSIKILGRLFLGAVLTFIFLLGLQKINNAIFDPIFQS